MSEDIFKPDYFSDCFVVEAIAIRANSIFKKWLEAQPKIYICDIKETRDSHALKSVHFVEPVGTTHEARLVDVKEIK